MSSTQNPPVSQSQQQKGQSGSVPQQHDGGVKLFDPTQFQNVSHHPDTVIQGDHTHKHPQTSSTSAYFSSGTQQGHPSSWDSWNSWDWDPQSQQAGGQWEGGVSIVDGQRNFIDQQHEEGSDGQHHKQSQQPLDLQHHSHQQSFNGYSEVNMIQNGQESTTKCLDHAAAFSYPEWKSDQHQGDMVPADMTQKQEQGGDQGLGHTGQFFGNGQQFGFHSTNTLNHHEQFLCEGNVNLATSGSDGFSGKEGSVIEQFSSPQESNASPMDHPKVTSMQQTDSGIGNTSLQTFNMSSGEKEIRDGERELAHHMESLHVKDDQLNQHIFASNNLTSSSEHSYQQLAVDGASQHTNNIGTGGLECQSVEQDSVFQADDCRIDQQNSVTKFVQSSPTDAHLTPLSVSNISGNNSLSFTSSPPQADVNEHSGSQTIEAPRMPCPSEPDSSQWQNSESFAGLSPAGGNASRISEPRSNSSSYQHPAFSTPMTSPGIQAEFPTPPSIPSQQDASPAVPPSSTIPLSDNHQTEPSISNSVTSNTGRTVGTEESLPKDSDKNVIDSQTTVGESNPSHDKLPDFGRSQNRQRGKEKDPPPASTGHHHRAEFQRMRNSRREKHNMSPATTLWENVDTGSTTNILLAAAAPFSVSSLAGVSPAQSDTTTSADPVSGTSTPRTSHPRSSLRKSSSNSSSLEKLYSERGERRRREREDGRYGSSWRRSERSSRPSSRSEGMSRSREEVNRSLGSLDELDATVDFSDDYSTSRSERRRSYGRDDGDARSDAYRDWSSNRADDYRRPRDAPYHSYGYRDPYYRERYDRPRSRQDDERSSRPLSRSTQEMDRPRSRAEYERAGDGYRYSRDPYKREDYPEYGNYNRHGYYYDDRDQRYYRDAGYRPGYAEDTGQFYGHPQQYDSRYCRYYYGYPHPFPPLHLHHPYQDVDRVSGVHYPSWGYTPFVDVTGPSYQESYGRTASRTDRGGEQYRQGYGDAGYGAGYYDHYYYQYAYNQYPQYDQQQHQQQSVSGYQQGRMTPPKYILPHVRVSFGPTGQLVTVMPTRPAEGQPATVDIHDVQVLLQDRPEVEEFKVFPGPLVREETHKRDVLLYCQTRERQCTQDVDIKDRESAELIWRLLELLLKQNGTLMGTDIADLLLDGYQPSSCEFTVRELPAANSQSSDPLQTGDTDLAPSCSTPPTNVTTDRTVMAASLHLDDPVDRFRNLLLYGRKKEALDWAMRNNLWGHALFLASKMDGRTHAGVMTRFANTAMKMSDPLQTLYQLMSGRQPAAITNAMDVKWGHWRPHLAIMLSNHSCRPELDKKSIIALGDTLASKHYLRASHVCYLMARAGFGSFIQKASKIVLIGANHNLPLGEFCTNGAIQCTEVYEYAQSLAGRNFNLPHFQVYKFLYACRLADYGFVQEAFHYMEVIALQVLQHSSLYHSAFVSILYAVSSQLKQGDPEKIHAGQDCADPTWLTHLWTVCQGHKNGSIQYKSLPATPMPEKGQWGVMDASSTESEQVAGHSIDGGNVDSQISGYLHNNYTTTTTNNNINTSHNYQHTWSQGAAWHEEDLAQHLQSQGIDQYDQQTNSQHTSGGQESLLYHHHQPPPPPQPYQQYHPSQDYPQYQEYDTDQSSSHHQQHHQHQQLSQHQGDLTDHSTLQHDQGPTASSSEEVGVDQVDGEKTATTGPEFKHSVPTSSDVPQPSYSSCISNLSHQIQQLTLKAQDVEGDTKPPQTMPVMFNPADLSHSDPKTTTSSGLSMKQGRQRVYPR